MLSEVDALMELTHPNIVRLHEYYRDEDALYLVEEYCSGGTLESRLKMRGGRLDANEVAIGSNPALPPNLPHHPSSTPLWGRQH